MWALTPQCCGSEFTQGQNLYLGMWLVLLVTGTCLVCVCCQGVLKQAGLQIFYKHSHFMQHYRTK